VIIVLFVPRYGFIACAWASFVSNLLMMLLSYFIGQKYFYIRYDLKSALVYGLLAATCYFAAMLPPIDSEILKISYRSFVLLIFICFAFNKEFLKKKVL
jgi:O-antigen/teichoic acid export membrane protein